MTKSRLLQIMPGGSGGTSGVIAYAQALETELARGGGTETRRLELGGSATRPEAETSRSLAGAGGELRAGDAVLLHYVGYGYHPRGVPRGVVEGFERARRGAVGVRFGVMFHEVWAFGPPWRSSFWTHPLQRRLARRLLAAADGAATSLGRYRELLAGFEGGPGVAVLPIPSTVGEPELVPAWAERSPRLAVFGSAGVRRRAWRGEAAALAAAVRALGVEEVVDLGAPCGAPSSVGGARVREAGALDAAGVSRELLAARAGFVAYPPDYLDKSTIYGAYLAHGVAPLCAWSGPRGRGPTAGESWLRASAGGIAGGAEPSAVAARAREAYSGRSVRRHAELWRSLLFAR